MAVIRPFLVGFATTLKYLFSGAIVAMYLAYAVVLNTTDPVFPGDVVRKP